MALWYDALFVSLLASFGMFARIGCEILFRDVLPLTSTATFVYPDLVNNMLGSLFIGVLFGFQSEIKRKHAHWYIGLSTGFCGSFTTFSGWTLSMTTLFLSRVGTQGGPAAAVFGWILGGLLAWGSFWVGLDLAAAARFLLKMPKTPTVAQASPTDRWSVVQVVGALAFIVCSFIAAALALKYDTVSTRRPWYVGMFFAPFGATLRFLVSKRFNRPVVIPAAMVSTPVLKPTAMQLAIAPVLTAAAETATTTATTATAQGEVLVPALELVDLHKENGMTADKHTENASTEGKGAEIGSRRSLGLEVDTSTVEFSSSNMDLSPCMRQRKIAPPATAADTQTQTQPQSQTQTQTAQEPTQPPAAVAPISAQEPAAVCHPVETDWFSFPFVGTFLVNVGASTLKAIFIMLAYRYSPNPAEWGHIVLMGLQFGFTACLSTVSTFVLELFTLHESDRAWQAYFYAFSTIVLAQSCALLVVGAGGGVGVGGG